MTSNITRSNFIEPFLEPLDSNGDYILPTTQYIANAAILVIFAYLVALVIMEVNYFRFAVWMAWRSSEHNKAVNCEYHARECLGRSKLVEEDEENNIVVKSTRSVSSEEEEVRSNHGENENDQTEVIVQGNHDAIDQGVMVVNEPQQPQHSTNQDMEISKHSAIEHLLDDVFSSLPTLHHTTPLRTRSATNTSNNDNTTTTTDKNDQDDTMIHPNNKEQPAPNLQKAYKTIHNSSLLAILSSLLIYTISAACIAIYTRGSKDEVIAVVVGTSKFVASVIVFILSAKVPQWIGVYHEGAIRLAKCSSNLSIHFMNMDLSNDQSIIKLRNHVLLGVSFHFAKFYILLLPFYVGVIPITIPFSMITGSITGLVLMWCIFLVHDRNRNRRNIVAFLTIFVCSVISSLLFVRGMAWIQVIWDLTLMNDENAILVMSFFGWLVFMMGVHALFVWHTLRMERRYKEEEVGGGEGKEGSNGNVTVDESKNSGGGRRSGSNDEEGGDEKEKDSSSPVETISTPSERAKMKRTGSYDSFLFDPRFQDDSFMGYNEPLSEKKTVGLSPSRSAGTFMIHDSNRRTTIDETPAPVVASNASAKSDKDATENTGEKRCCKQRRRRNHHHPDWCTLFMCFTPEYTKMSCFWKTISWIKGVVIALSYLLCLYFVAVTLGATRQISSTKKNLPSVRKALYETQNEGPVCAFDNRGAASNITTFENKDAAHDAGFLIVHCGACGACSSWENLIIEYTTRNNMAALANKCAMRGLFGGEDEITACIMEPAIGFTEECALCWTEDIVCTKKHCSYIFLQSQITNNVGNFQVGPDDITSATCEEAHCEVGQFVPCVGATRRRMNIVSSIARPIEEQCQIVDVDWAELFAEYDV